MRFMMISCEVGKKEEKELLKMAGLLHLRGLGGA